MEHQTLDRWLRHFGILYTDKTVSLNEVREAVAKGRELNDPGKLLWYRAMQNKIRQKHELNVLRELVYGYAVMCDLDPKAWRVELLERRKLSQKVILLSKAHSLDGHDKMMGYQNSTCPLAI